MACHNGLTTPTGEDVSIGLRLARQHDGQLVARSVLAGERAARNDRSSGVAGGDRGRMLRSATCRWRVTKRSCDGQQGEVFSHLPFDADEEAGPAGRRRRVVLGVPPDREGQARHARELQRRLRRRRAGRRRTSSRSTVRSRSRRDNQRIMRTSTGGFQPDGGDAHPRIGAVRHVPHAVSPRRSGRTGKVIGELAGADAVSGMAAQRLTGQAKLPGLPHAGGEGSRRRSRRVLGRAARRHGTGTCSSAAISSCCGC